MLESSDTSIGGVAVASLFGVLRSTLSFWTEWGMETCTKCCKVTPAPEVPAADAKKHIKQLWL